MQPTVRVGTACFVWKDDRFLVVQRHGSHGNDTWALPGGHLEFGETWADCVIREVREETGMEIADVQFLAITEDLFPAEDKHYISIWTTADWKSGEAKIMEPQYCKQIAWSTFKELPSPLFEPCWANFKRTKPELFS